MMLKSSNKFYNKIVTMSQTKINAKISPVTTGEKHEPSCSQSEGPRGFFSSIAPRRSSWMRRATMALSFPRSSSHESRNCLMRASEAHNTICAPNYITIRVYKGYISIGIHIEWEPYQSYLLK